MIFGSQGDPPALYIEVVAKHPCKSFERAGVRCESCSSNKKTASEESEGCDQGLQSVIEGGDENLES